MKPNLVPLSLALLVGAAQAQTEDQFEPWQTIGYTSAGPRDFTDGIDIAPADLDGDGLMDVVFSGKLQGSVFSAIWKGINDGNGGFSLSLAHVLGSQAGASVKTWDMDSDGDMDVVVARTSAGDDRLLWLENQGDGTFGTQH
ncbi:MAG: VCBS repeat-containing protein, partial [Planctomycetota bacterium]|nr:VCBS repeat-containing protein [Planctomycetota bacterium]